ncbi:MAG: CPBP family intramembrane metalloprotease, partial [Clostridia bacterium]|nr:CPBP family intramembrane metalloprotease [Clostridia bacterium]
AFPMAAVSVGDKSATSICITIISSALVPAVFEEYLYRRFLCKEFTIHGGAFAIIISALLFALAHFSFNNFPYAFVCGLVLGVVYLKTGSVKYTVAIHFANNFLGYTLSLIGSEMNSIDYMNMIVLIVIALVVMTVGAVYVIFPNKEKFAFCQSGNVASSAFLTFPMVVYIFCSMLMNFI